MIDNPISDRQRVSVEHVRLLLEKAESIGLSSTAILRQCRLSYDLAHIRSHRISHLPLRDFVSLRGICIQQIRARLATPDDSGMADADFDLMCHSLITSLTLEEVIERLHRFFEVAGGRYGHSKLDRMPDGAAFELQLGPIEAGWNFFFTLNAFKLFTRLFSWMIGTRLTTVYETACADDPDNRATASIFGMDLRYGADVNRMIFPEELLEQPIVRTPADLRTFLQHFPFDAVVSQNVQANLSSRIEGLYRSALLNHAPLPTLSVLARNVGLGSATLRRHLDREGKSIREIKEMVREDLARQYLQENRLSVSEIAENLGFSGIKAFARAFRQWSGSSPAAYHRLHSDSAMGEPANQSSA